MKRYRRDSEQSKSGTSARSLTEGSSPSCVVESNMKDREVVFRNIRTTSNQRLQKLTRKSWR